MNVHVLVSWSHDEGMISVLGVFDTRRGAEDFIAMHALDATRCQISSYQVREAPVHKAELQPVYLRDIIDMIKVKITILKPEKPTLINHEKLENMMQWMDRNIDAATVARLRALQSAQVGYSGARSGARRAIAVAKAGTRHALMGAKRSASRNYEIIKRKFKIALSH